MILHMAVGCSDLTDCHETMIGVTKLARQCTHTSAYHPRLIVVRGLAVSRQFSDTAKEVPVSQVSTSSGVVCLVAESATGCIGLLLWVVCTSSLVYRHWVRLFYLLASFLPLISQLRNAELRV